MARIVTAMLLILCCALPALALPPAGSALPALKLPDASGETVDLAQAAKGKVTVLVYWSISCPHCRAEMPHLMDMNRELSGNPFAMLMINGDTPDMARAAKKMAEDYKMPAPCLIDAGPDDTMPAADAFDVVATPTILVYGKDGKLIQAQELTVDMAKLKEAVTAAF